MAYFCLPDTMNTFEPMLQAVGVPWQVIVYHQMRTLQVDTFSGSVSRYQYAHIFILLKKFFQPFCVRPEEVRHEW